MKKEAKAESKAERYQVLVRVDPEEHTRLTELGASAGFSSANQFMLEAMRRYGDILADAIIEENRELAEVQKRHREHLRAKIQSSRRS